MNTPDLILANDGPVISIPVALLTYIGDIALVAMLRQGAFLSALSRRNGNDGWFFLNQEGEPDGDSFYGKLGSWAALGLGAAKAQLRLRRKLMEMNLWEEQRREVPARLFYRVNLEKYVQLLEASGAALQIRQKGESGFVTSTNLAAPFGQIQIRQNGESNTEIDTEKETYPLEALHGPVDNLSEQVVPDSILDIWELEVALNIAPSRRAASLQRLSNLKCIDGQPLSFSDWSNLLDRLRQVDDPASWLTSVARTGYQPGRLSAHARPGESVSAAKARISQTRERNVDVQRVASLVQQIERVRLTNPNDWSTHVDALLRELSRLAPQHPLLKLAGFHT